MKHAKLTGNETTMLMVNLICNKLFILAPIYFKQKSGCSSLIITSVVFAIIFILWNFYCNTYRATEHVPNQSILLKKISVIAIHIIGIMIISASIQQYSLALSASVLKNTPLKLISFFLILAMISGSLNSLKSIATVGKFFVPAVYITALLLVLLSAEKRDFYNFFPIIDTSVTELLTKITLMLSLLFETIFFYFLPQFLKSSNAVRKIGNKTIIYSYICFLVIGVIFSITFLSFENTNQEPFFRIIRMAHLGEKNANFDSVFLILYCISAYIYLTSMLLILNKTAELAFTKHISKIFYIVGIALIVIISLNSYLYNAIFEFFSYHYYILFTVTFVAPLILTLKEKVKRCKLKK